MGSKDRDYSRAEKRAAREAEAAANFLGSVEGSYTAAVGNCEMDARSYGWSLETVGFIRAELAKMFAKGELTA